jgi:hypothetical protein
VADSDEPLDEEIEISWLTFLRRFETQIYPSLFKSSGISMSDAMLLWELSNLRNEITSLREDLSDKPYD